MKYIFVAVFVAMLFSGCGVVQCIDNNIERKPVPILHPYNVELEYKLIKYHKEIQCEKYYDSMCAERGNYWATRAVGQNSSGEELFIEIQDESLGSIRVDLPSCSKIVKNEKVLIKNTHIHIAGVEYYFVKRDGDFYTFKTWGRTNPEAYIKIMFKLKINDYLVE